MYEAQVWCLINRNLFVHRIMDVHQKVRNLFSGNYRLMTCFHMRLYPRGIWGGGMLHDSVKTQL